MRNKKYFYFDEKRIAEEFIKNGFDSQGIDYNAMYIVSKYFREIENLGGKDLKKRVINFCKQHNKNFNPVLEREQISKWISSAMKYNLRKIEEVYITEKEVEFLKTIVSNRDRKLLFIMLIFSKGLKQGNTRRGKTKYKKSEQYYIRYGNFLDIVRLSELTHISEVTFAKILHKYKDHLLLYNPEKELIRLDYAYPDSKISVEITDFTNLVGEYQKIFGKHMSYCQICGKEIEKVTNNQKYCDDCSKEANRLRVKKFREKNV